MKVETLNQTNPAREEELYLDYWALYRGGKEFRARIGNFLKQNPAELDDLYEIRKREAHYVSYLGPIVDFFAAHLFAKNVTKTAKVAGSEKATEAPAFYEDFGSNCDGKDKDFEQLLHDQFLRAAVKGKAFWALDFPEVSGPEATDRADWEKRGFGDIKIRSWEREQALDWCETEGNLDWILFHEETVVRRDWKSNERVRVNRWWVYDRTHVTRYVHEEKEGSTQKELNPVARLEWSFPHNLGRVPIVELKMPDGCWIADRVESAQLECFRIGAGQNYAIRRTCYATAVFKVQDKDDPPIMGPGSFWMCSPEESLEWPSPSSDVFSTTQEEQKRLKDEIYRIVHQMSMGVENNAAAVGRSAGSKIADAASLEVILRSFGGNVREAIGQTFRLLSEARKDEIEWSFTGLDHFGNIDPEVLLGLLLQSGEAGINSEVFTVEATQRVASGLLPGLTEERRQEMDKQLQQAASARAEHERLTRYAPTARVPGDPEVDPARLDPKASGGGRDNSTATVGGNRRGVQRASA